MRSTCRNNHIDDHTREIHYRKTWRRFRYLINIYFLKLKKKKKAVETRQCELSYCLPFLELQLGHLYCCMVSAFAGVIFTHFPWYHLSHISHPIQNSFELQFPPQLPQRVSLCSSSSSPYPSLTALELFFVCPSLDLCYNYDVKRKNNKDKMKEALICVSFQSHTFDPQTYEQSDRYHLVEH